MWTFAISFNKFVFILEEYTNIHENKNNKHSFSKQRINARTCCEFYNLRPRIKEE